MAYFLVSVSNKINLDLCIKHALAGFTNSINGLWTFAEIQEGDFISFLYGARVFNLYKVEKKEAIKNANQIGPWPSVTFRMSGKTYYFPFRLYLNPLREFIEPMVRPEFAYVAENLLLRGGYRKTHFQADQTTLQSVSQMGSICNKPVENLKINDYETFVPMLTWNRSLVSPPEVFYFQEFILQSLTRQWLSQNANLQFLFDSSELNTLQASDFEVLGEKALPEGHIDILIKDRMPVGYNRNIIVEVKTGKAKTQDIVQLGNYAREIGKECISKILIARVFPKKLQQGSVDKEIKCFIYTFDQINKSQKYTLEELKANFNLISKEVIK
ncbi:MAG: hypothetical protein QME57_04865 [Patescibacteria group bacterium]|nr:hypothetical protein [Patescibacteria group bacterium]